MEHFSLNSEVTKRFSRTRAAEAKRSESRAQKFEKIREGFRYDEFKLMNVIDLDSLTKLL